jgi:Protein of unknown function (DUF3575)
MKKILILLTFCLFSILKINAQPYDGSAGSSPWDKFKSYFGNSEGKGGGDGDAEELIHKNIFKINLPAIGFNNYSVQYERILNQKISFAIGGRYMPETKLPIGTSFKDQLKDAETSISNGILSTTLSNFAVTPELKFYLSKQAGKGFYLSIMARYEEWTLNMPYVNVLNSGKSINTKINGSRKGGGAGAVLGTQFSLGSRIALDWWIGGAYFGPQTYNLVAESNFNFTSSEITQLNDAFTVITPLFDVKGNVTANKIEVTSSNSFTPSIRTGLCLGFRF